MRILHIACLNGSKYSGVCGVVPEHIKAQTKIADVGFINITGLKIEGIEKQFDFSGSIESIINNFVPDIVVFHEAYRFPYLKIARELKKNKIPYVIIPHGELNNEAQKKKRIKKWVANLLLFNNFINNAVAIQCLSEKELQSTKFGKHKFIGTNGINIPEKIKTSFNTDKIIFVYIGRLDPYHKGLDLMIDAINRKADFLRENNCEFNIYGPDSCGGYQTVMELIYNANVEDFVHLHKAVTGKEKEKILLSSDVFIQTSRFEGMPMGILEAMSYGLPCLLTSGTTLGEFINNNNAGWNVETDAENIAQGMVSVLENKDKFNLLSKNSIDSVRKTFAWDIVSNETVATYKTMVS